MASNSTRWDIGEEVVTRTTVARPLVGAIAASSINIVFGVLTLAGLGFPQTTVANRSAVLEVIRVERRDVQTEVHSGRHAGDTQHGMSTGRLAAVFPSLFEPAHDEDNIEPFFMS